MLRGLIVTVAAVGALAYVARKGGFYHRQFGRHGLADEAAAIQRASDEGGPQAEVAAELDNLPARSAVIRTTGEGIERLDVQAEAGVDLPQVSIVDPDPRGVGKRTRAAHGLASPPGPPVAAPRAPA